ncbi:MAG: hypothetical protein ACI9K2_007653, partial [Myxococcota bacterium]
RTTRGRVGSISAEPIDPQDPARHTQTSEWPDWVTEPSTRSDETRASISIGAVKPHIQIVVHATLISLDATTCPGTQISGPTSTLPDQGRDDTTR